MTEKKLADVEWEYPRVVEVLEAAVLHAIHDYIQRRQSNIAYQVSFCPIYELCIKSKRRLGTIQMMILWDQDMVN